MDVVNKNDHSEVPFLSRSAPFMDDIVVSNEDVTTLLKGSVVVPYCYLFLLSVFILWFSYYVSDIFCKF